MTEFNSSELSVNWQLVLKVPEMLFWLHLGLLSLIILSTPFLAIRGRHGPQRTTKEVLGAVAPFVSLGILCLCLANARGVPTIEWLLPALSVLLLSIFCRSAKLFQITWWTLFVATILLCANLLVLFDDDYVRNVDFVVRVSEFRNSRIIAEAQRTLQKNFPADLLMEQRPIATILNDNFYNTIQITTTEREWHTVITGLYRVKHEQAALWYPGGPMKTGAQQLLLRKLEPNPPVNRIQ